MKEDAQSIEEEGRVGTANVKARRGVKFRQVRFTGAGQKVEDLQQQDPTRYEVEEEGEEGFPHLNHVIVDVGGEDKGHRKKKRK